jgi:hypothetical protein
VGSNTKRLSILAARTDHDLLILVQRELDRGFVLADRTNTRNSPLFALALKAHATATAILPRVSGLSQEQREEFEARLKDLRYRLDEVPAYANLSPYPASFAS